MENLLKNDKDLIKNNELINTKIHHNEFDIIMAIYQKALDNTMQKFINLKQLLKEHYDYDLIINIIGRLKSPQSIAEKMKKKKIDINYENMIEHINDIAGMRIICNYKDDIYKIRNIIRKQKDMKIIKEKDYLKKAKKSGYSAYHIIVEVPVEIKQDVISVKVEIQIRTVLMDFWASTEHKVKYKPKKKLSNVDSIKLSLYARIINAISDKMMKIHRKQRREMLVRNGKYY